MEVEIDFVSVGGAPEKKSGLWIEASMEKTRDKVAHDFRNLRRNANIAATDTSGSDIWIPANQVVWKYIRKNIIQYGQPIADLWRNFSSTSQHGI